MPAALARCNPLLDRVLVTARWVLAVVLALIAGLASDAATAAPKRPRPKRAAKADQGAFDKALDAEKPAIVGCVMMHGISKGAPSVALAIKILVNRQGQVFSLELQVTQEGGDKEQMSTCVQQVLNHIHFPPSSSAFTEMRRQWSFAQT